MASCFTLTSTPSGTLPVYTSEATKTNGAYTCGSGAHIMLTADDFQASTWTTADGVSLGWTIGGIWLSVYAVMFIARTVRKMLEVQDDPNT